MDKSDLENMLRYAHKNNMMSRPLTFVYKWYKIQYSL